jgi:redox-sensitive bicupin YhaK (pirin superfamily)
MVQVITAREVPLGGPRAMSVRRTLPQRRRSMVGAWCFVDHYGPDDVAETGGMDVAPHPHTGLQTVSWLFTGEIEHRDTCGSHALVRPGELNLMTAGHGVAHSEVSTPGTDVLHGVQLWLALPDSARDTTRDFRHHVPEPVRLDGAVVRVLLGGLAGSTSPVPTFSPLLGAEVLLDPGAEVSLEVDPAFEHGVLVDRGPVRLDGTELRPSDLGYVPPRAARLLLGNPGEETARVMLLGGQPFGEPIVEYREAWESGSDRFGTFEGYDGQPRRIPAPSLPHVRIRPRLDPPGPGDPSAWG